MLKGCCSCF